MAATWQDQLYEHLKQLGISLICYVPDGGHATAISRAEADPDVIAIPLTTEAEGVPLLAGHHLGGGKGVLLMQSSGVGNCVYQFSLIHFGRFPFYSIITMRGEFGEQNPWQVAMGRGVQPVMEAMGMMCLRADREDEVLTTASGADDLVFGVNHAVGLMWSNSGVDAKQVGGGAP